MPTSYVATARPCTSSPRCSTCCATSSSTGIGWSRRRSSWSRCGARASSRSRPSRRESRPSAERSVTTVEQRVIRTVHGRGYRFVAPIDGAAQQEVVGVDRVGPVPTSPLLERAGVEGARRGGRGQRRVHRARGAGFGRSGDRQVGTRRGVRHHNPHVRVLAGACDDLVTPRPLGAIHDVAAEGFPGLVAALARPSPGDLQTRAARRAPTGPIPGPAGRGGRPLGRRGHDRPPRRAGAPAGGRPRGDRAHVPRRRHRGQPSAPSPAREPSARCGTPRRPRAVVSRGGGRARRVRARRGGGGGHRRDPVLRHWSRRSTVAATLACCPPPSPTSFAPTSRGCPPARASSSMSSESSRRARRSPPSTSCGPNGPTTSNRPSGPGWSS